MAKYYYSKISLYTRTRLVYRTMKALTRRLERLGHWSNVIWRYYSTRYCRNIDVLLHSHESPFQLMYAYVCTVRTIERGTTQCGILQ